MKLQAIAAYLDSLGHGIQGQTLFVDEMPAECKEGILLLDTYSGTQINHYLPGYRATGFRVAVRSTDHDAGHELATTVVSALTVHTDTVVEGITVRQMLPLNDPRPYRRSVGAYWEFEVDVDIVFNVNP
jgi:hypothetical protein